MELTLLYFFYLEKGLDHIAENILSYLDDSSLRNAELVCKEWRRVIADGMLWKKLIERKVCNQLMCCKETLNYNIF